ncbi:alpha-glycosidase [Marinicrinis sediminis]|uniref:Alpha-glycosidase n=1 Tax=Marinicrinis sediminis TaxID=1652465 RepID=A0ABW5R9I0_9BACL
MLLEAIYHRPKQNWCYAYDQETLHVRIRTKRNDISKVTLVWGDKYRFDTYKYETEMTVFASDRLFDYWEASVKPPFRRFTYGFLIHGDNEQVWFDEKGFSDEISDDIPTYFNFPYMNKPDIHEPPAWVKEAVFYQIFPERFANGDPSLDPEHVEEWGGTPTPYNYFGGDIQGVIDHLDHLQKLGVTCIYFTPLFESPTNHKYDTIDYMKIDPQFGDEEKLKELVRECHQRDMKVMLDAVFNHSGRLFEPFQDVIKHGPDSKYADWFIIREFPIDVVDDIPTYDTFSFERNMPKFNTENPEVKEYLLNVARYWIEEVGIDSWRLDVANEVDHQFWREFRQAVKEINPDVYILGEIWHDSMMWLQGDQFDAVMNYLFTNSVLDFFAKDAVDSKQFAEAIYSLQAFYPQHISEVMFNLLDSHDTPRLLHMCQEDKRKMKLAALFQLTYTGAPCIYYGDEFGLTGENDPGCRKCMVWEEKDQDLDLFDFYRNLIALRRMYPAFRTGSLTFLQAEAEDKRLVYERRDEHHSFIIAVNNEDKAQTISFPLDQGRYEDVWAGDPFTHEQGLYSVSLQPYDFVILKKQLKSTEVPEGSAPFANAACN